MNDDTSNVHDLFSRAELPLPQTEESMWAEDFIENRIPEAQQMLDAMILAPTEDTFIEYLREVKRLVASWPEVPS